MVVPQPSPKAWAIFSAVITAMAFATGAAVGNVDIPRWLRDVFMAFVGLSFGVLFVA